MIQVFEYVDFSDGDLTAVGERFGYPVYGVVDGISLQISGYDNMPAMKVRRLWGRSVNRLREIEITKSTAPEPFHGAIYTFENETPSRRKVPILNVSADTLPKLLYAMNREIYFIRQALADTVH